MLIFLQDHRGAPLPDDEMGAGIPANRRRHAEDVQVIQDHERRILVEDLLGDP
jgi:hypothetical protein